MNITNVDITINVDGEEIVLAAVLDKRLCSDARELRRALQDHFRTFFAKVHTPPPPAKDPPPVSQPVRRKDQRPTNWSCDITKNNIRRKGTKTFWSMADSLINGGDREQFIQWWNQHGWKWRCSNKKQNRYQFKINGCDVISNRALVLEYFNNPLNFDSYLSEQAITAPTPFIQKLVELGGGNKAYFERRCKELHIEDSGEHWRLFRLVSDHLTLEQLHEVIINCPPVASTDVPTRLINGYGQESQDKEVRYRTFGIFRVKTKFYTAKFKEIKSIAQALNVDHPKDIHTKPKSFKKHFVCLRDAKIPNMLTVQQWAKKRFESKTDSESESESESESDSESESESESDVPDESVDESKDDSPAAPEKSVDESKDDAPAADDAPVTPKKSVDESKDDAAEKSVDEVQDDSAAAPEKSVDESKDDTPAAKDDIPDESKESVDEFEAEKNDDEVRSFNIHFGEWDAFKIDFVFDSGKHVIFTPARVKNPCADVSEEYRFLAVKQFLNLVEKENEHIVEFLEEYGGINKKWTLVKKHLSKYLAEDFSFLSAGKKRSSITVQSPKRKSLQAGLIPNKRRLRKRTKR